MTTEETRRRATVRDTLHVSHRRLSGLAEVRDDMVRQVSYLKQAREPRNNRRLGGPRS